MTKKPQKMTEIPPEIHSKITKKEENPGKTPKNEEKPPKLTKIDPPRPPPDLFSKDRPLPPPPFLAIFFPTYRHENRSYFDPVLTTPLPGGGGGGVPGMP